MEVRTQKYQAEVTGASKDLQDVKTTIAINYHINPSDAPKIYQTIGKDYSERVIYPTEQETNKETTAQYTAEELITRRNEVKETMRKAITEKLGQRNIIVEDVSIINFQFSESFTQAIEAKVTAEQNALKEQNNLKMVEFQAQQAIAKAKGEAQAIELVNNQLKQSPQYVNYMMIQKWNGIMPMVLGGGQSLLNIIPPKANQTV